MIKGIGRHDLNFANLSNFHYYYYYLHEGYKENIGNIFEIKNQLQSLV